MIVLFVLKNHLPTEIHPHLYRLHGYICGPINPPSVVFRYYFILIDASKSHLEGLLSLLIIW